MKKELKTYYIGIDIGSTTIKMIAIDQEGKLVFNDYRRHNTDIKMAARLCYEEMYRQLGDCWLSMAMTGSVGMGYAERTSALFVQEVVAAAELVKAKYPQVRTFVDIGGEDSKMIFFEDGKIPDIRMNGNCAGGTGAFIDQTAALLEIETVELNNLASKATTIYPIASRCGVFSKTDIQNLASRNVSRNDIAASVFNAIAIQVISSLAKGTDILPKLFFCGGPFAFLPELKKAFIRVLNMQEEDCILPEHAELIPAWGCALIAKGNVEGTKRRLLESIHYVRMQKEDPFANENTNRLPALFQSKEDFEQWKAKKQIYFVPKTTWEDLESEECFLGVDSGSTTTKAVLLDKKGRIVYTDYLRNKGNSFKAFTDILLQMKETAERFGKNIKIVGSTATGYGENLLKAAFNLNHGLVETIAHFLAAKQVKPDLSFVLDIGGQDMKAIYVENGSINRLEINEACSSGCGSFIESFANMLHYPVAEFAEIACYAKRPYDLGTRCTVFMNSKVKQAMREGAATDDIAAGFSYSVVKNCLFKVLKIKNLSELGEHIVVQGGTFKNLSIVRALELMTNKDVYFSDIAELMGAYGAALYAKERYQGEAGISLSQLTVNQQYDADIEICKGCENNCTVKIFKFINGNTFYSGNNCEKIYSNKAEGSVEGTNQHQIKYKDLFNRPIAAKKDQKLRIGIPRALGMYENYPFWHSLLTNCGITPILSATSSNKIYEKGIRSIMSDNICYPAKLMHGHIFDLIEKKVDRILYPYVVFEQKEDKKSRNSYNCPIVAGYSDVIKSSIEPLENHGITIDSPVVSFNNKKLLVKSCTQYLKSLNIDAKTIKKAIELAIVEQSKYLHKQSETAIKIVENAKREGRMVIVLACRPYHLDPLIQHKISDCIAQMGIDVVTENIANFSNEDIFEQIHSVSQWAYPNRIFKAAKYVSDSKENIHFVQLTSFGCGPDAFILDEIGEVLNRGGKNLTLLKIDDVNNIGSLRLRIRSVVESLQFKGAIHAGKTFKTTKIFKKEERFRTILAPYFAEGYSELLPPLFKLMGYNLVNLPMGDKESTEIGLKYANNDVCYPATIVVGSIIKALQSGKYDLGKIAIGMTQTGGQCRASNYISLIKSALVNAGFEQVPVISVAFGDDVSNIQPGFELKWSKCIKTALIGLMFSDALSKLSYPTMAREGETEKGKTKQLRQQYLEKAALLIEQKNKKGFFPLLNEAVDDFTAIAQKDKKIPSIGIVGEIYIKYNSFGHKHVVDWLSEQGIEVVAPSMYNFFINSFVNAHVNKSLNIKNIAAPLWVYNSVYKMVRSYARKFDKIGKRFPYYRPFADMFEDAKLASEVINLAANFGEGWLIPAELAGFAKNGVNNAISLQPFGCIANHVIAKGIEKRIKKIYPKMNLLALDFDAGTSEANIFNRLHFMVKNCKE